MSASATIWTLTSWRECSAFARQFELEARWDGPWAERQETAMTTINWSLYQIPPKSQPSRASRSPITKPVSRPLASVGNRFLAAVIDQILFLLPIVVVYILPRITKEPASSSTAYMPFWVWFVFWAMTLIVQTTLLSMRGQTIGKIVQGVRIVDCVDDSNPGFFRQGYGFVASCLPRLASFHFSAKCSRWPISCTFLEKNAGVFMTALHTRKWWMPSPPQAAGRQDSGVFRGWAEERCESVEVVQKIAGMVPFRLEQVIYPKPHPMCANVFRKRKPKPRAVGSRNTRVQRMPWKSPTRPHIKNPWRGGEVIAINLHTNNLHLATHLASLARWRGDWRRDC